MRTIALWLTPLTIVAITPAFPATGARLIVDGGFEVGTGNDLPGWERILLARR